MMFAALGIGLLASVLVSLGVYLQEGLRGAVPLVLLGVAAIAAVFQKYAIDRLPTNRNYEGFSDLLIQIHTPSLSDVPWRWAIRGFVSFLLAIFGGIAGSEGAAIEFAYAAAVQSRSRASRWFENRRRTDAASAIAAGISAAFGAPFAGVLLPMEMSIGGRALHSAVASIAAFAGMRYLSSVFPLRHFELGGTLYGFGLSDWREWLAVLAISVLAGVLGTFLVKFVRYCRSSLFQLYRSRGWMRILAGGVLLYLIAALFRGGFAPSFALLEDVLWLRKTTEEAGLILFSQLLILAVVLSTFGTTGILWPLFAIGGTLGFILNQSLFGSIPGFSAASGLVGASALWGAVLGTPIAAAVLCYELSRNLQLLLPCLFAGMLAREIVRILGGRKLVEVGLEARGLRIVEGRSVSVLESIFVKDAMVTDHVLVREHEAVSELQERLVLSRYPILPVVRHDGRFAGILTLDMVQEAWHTDQTVTSFSQLSKLLEVKDLLYRSGFKTPSVTPEQKLSEVTSLLDRFPCLPVVDGEGLILGLLLAQNVRQAYDREVVRRSLELASL